jgi:serine/threonine protein kinase
MDSGSKDLQATSSSAAASANHTATSPAELNGLVLFELIGSGTFGRVYLGELDGTPVAVKKCVVHPRSANREVEILRKVTAHPHPNIITLKQAFTEHDEWEETTCLVMDLFPMSLDVLISDWARSGRGPRSAPKLFSYQLARALAHIHGMSIVHRDIKPHNVLVNPTRGVLKLADFGSSKTILPEETNTTYIGSRFYRAPECLLDNQSYTTAIDLWALGCVVAEMAALQPVFRGRDSADQLYRIMRALGLPSERDFSQLNSKLDRSLVQSLLQAPQPRKSWRDIIRNANISGKCAGFLENLLRWSPAERMSARESLAAPYFDTIRNLTHEQLSRIDCNLFDFTEYELSNPAASDQQ